MSILSDFQAVVGHAFVTENRDGIFVSPATTEEVSAVLRLCSEQSISVTPSGSRTKLTWGNPVQTGLRLATGRISGVREHIWQDMTATVGAGTRWSDMQTVFTKHGQHVALDACFASEATVGGTVSVNDSGALRIKYGSLRDLVIGMTIVLADGTIARSGGKVVKNVAGYDLPKLLIGSFGTLGVITEVNFRLHPLEAGTQTWSVIGDFTALGKLMQKLRVSAMSLQSLQLRSDGENIVLDVRFASAPAALEHDANRLNAMCTGLELAQAGDEVWDWRGRLFAEPDAAILKVTCLPTQIEAIVSGFHKAAVKAQCAGDAVGIITVQLSGDPELMVPLIQDLRARLGATGGMVAVLQWPYPSLPVERWGGSPPAIAVMRGLKQQFDPKRFLNPGKFVGGI